MTGQAVASNQPLTSPLLGISTTTGVAGALLMGVVSWVLLLIDRNMPLAIVFGATLIGFTGLVFLFLRSLPSRQGVAGLLSGLIGGLISIIFLGSLMVVQTPTFEEFKTQTNQFSAGGIALTVGFIAGLMFLGWAAGTVRSRLPRYSSTKVVCWRARFAWVVALSYLPLIAVGGLVTSTESGLAVPDSFTTYGAIGILFPLSLMEEIRIYMEHSHRIFGTFAGITTIVFVVRMFGAPGWIVPRLMSVALLVGVIAQGVMGALRVSEQSQALAAVHGVLAQVVFALAIAAGVVSSQRWGAIQPNDEGIEYGRGTRTMLLLAAGAMGIQLVFGSITRHMESGHALMSHIGFSFFVLMLVLIAGAKCIRLGKVDRGSNAIRPYGSVIHGLVTVQFALGWGALAMTWTGDEAHPSLPTSGELASAHGIRVGETLVATSHHVIGALLLATVVGALMWGLRIASRPKSC